MSCGGNMMRTGMAPLAHLVDAAAEHWLAFEDSNGVEREAALVAITRTFHPRGHAEVTFHGLRYTLTVSQDESGERLLISAHEIDTDD